MHGGTRSETDKPWVESIQRARTAGVAANGTALAPSGAARSGPCRTVAKAGGGLPVQPDNGYRRGRR